MTVEQRFTSTLAALPCSVSQPPGTAEDDTYCTFFEVSGSYLASASNQTQRIRHLVQLHVYSLLEDGTHRALFFQALALLKAAGVKVTSWGLDDYEQETRRHHISCTCSWVEPPKQDGQEE